MTIEIRPVQQSEQLLIFTFLFLAARMPEGGEPIQTALVDPFLRKYWVNWGRPGDLGTVCFASETGMPISCSWIRLFHKDEAGIGFVAEGIPELATGTVEGFRNKGVGFATLTSLIDHARVSYRGIALNVREDNPAVRLYERLSFKRVPGSEAKNRIGTRSFNMLLEF